MDRIERLRPENQSAWAQFQRLCTRFLVECQGIGAVLDRLGRDEDTEDFMDLVARFSVLYDIYYPPKKAGKS